MAQRLDARELDARELDVRAQHSEWPTLILDIETAPLASAADYLDAVEAAKNLKDPVKIAADIATRTAAQREVCALDWNVARIVAIGTSDGHETVADWCATEAEESQSLSRVWAAIGPRTRVVGFCVRTFDLPFLVQRSRYLGITPPTFDLGRYARDWRILDLYDVLTFHDLQRTYAMRRTLHAFCRRFGIASDDTVTGADVPALVAAGDRDAILAHVREDVRLTIALARRLGYLPEGR
jgi:hypothetical protein